MAKRILTEEQKEARRERARKRRAARKAAAGTATETKTPKAKKEKKAKVVTDPSVKSQITSAHTEDDIIAPQAKKVRKSRKERMADEAQATEAPKVTLFASLDSVKEHQFHRFTDNDDYKNVNYMVKTRTGSSTMRGLFCKITAEGRIDPSEYSKLEKAKAETGFLGFVKE